MDILKVDREWIEKNYPSKQKDLIKIRKEEVIQMKKGKPAPKGGKGGKGGKGC